ncbi:MAG: small multidrug resistance protein [Oscillatoriophycideae cyanobacterium NC_groundwater_1537_Pr4_S-0.65um_50_18]|nr:small multidrug resistance protein [Oscillatoriophycideae cyanobacterium NC_groundwater_1537_Pr4_S-0.65um_50_18]
MYLLLAVAAALSYTIGGIFMKLSEGFAHPIPSLLVYLLFLIGASLQIYITNNAHLGITYMLVIGLETACAVFFSLFIFKEGYSPLTVAGIFLIAAGTVFLRVEAK